MGRQAGPWKARLWAPAAVTAAAVAAAIGTGTTGAGAGLTGTRTCGSCTGLVDSLRPTGDTGRRQSHSLLGKERDSMIAVHFTP